MTRNALLAAVAGTFGGRPAPNPISIFSDEAVNASANVIWWDTAVISWIPVFNRAGFGRKLGGNPGANTPLGATPDSLVPASAFADGVACHFKEFATARGPDNPELLIHFETAAERSGDRNGTNNLTDNLETNGAILIENTDNGERSGMKFSYDLDSAEPYNLNSSEIIAMEAGGTFDMYTKFRAWATTESAMANIRMALVDLSAGHGINLSDFTIRP